jgi:hypothetical protein
MVMLPFLHPILQPALYHGHGKQAPFFEGWYFKLVSADETARFAIIPGVILSGDPHAFVQVLDGNTRHTQYHRYPLKDFWAARDEFQIAVGPNRFNLNGFTLDLDNAQGRVQGQVTFGPTQPWPVRWYSPGIMGWYAWLPFMECYHGVLSFDHRLEGVLTFDQQVSDFTEGRGYIEKDWGKSFPEAYVWLQSNHFQEPGISLVVSVAIIPWLGSAFPGFIVGFWRKGELHRFATYTGAQIRDLTINPQEVSLIFEDKKHRLELKAQRSEGGLIKGPTTVDMGQRIHETLGAEVQVTLSTGEGEVLFTGRGCHGGLEVFEPEKLLGLIKK